MMKELIYVKNLSNGYLTDEDLVKVMVDYVRIK